MIILNKRFSLILTLAFSLFAHTYVMAGEEKVIPLKDVPSEILRIAKQLLPDAEFVTADIEKEADGVLVYEIQGTLEDGRKVEVDLYENGEVQEYEVEFSINLVPGAVTKAIESKYPGFEPKFIEASHSPSKKVTQYEFFGEQDGNNLYLDVSADGRKIVVSDQ